MYATFSEASSSSATIKMQAPLRERRRQKMRAVSTMCADEDSNMSRESTTSTRRRIARQSLASLALIGLALLASLLPSASAQRVRQQADDPITIVGTWSSGSGQVQTGLNFFNPLNQTFNVPRVGGQSYSFTADGFWEQSLFTFTPDPGQPNCAQAQLIWQHGNYTMNTNGSLTLNPFVGDGRQMIQNGCSQVSSSVQPYDQQEYMQGFYIRKEWHYNAGAYYLQMYEFNGVPKPWLWQIYNPPNMLPTQQLRQVTYGHVSNAS